MPAPTGARVRHSDAYRADYIAKRQQGVSNRQACADMRINPKTGDRWWADWNKRQVRSGNSATNPPRTLKKIRQNAASRRAYDDFAWFREKCFGRLTPPWQRKAIEVMRAAVEGERREFICMNVFPGAGKTVLYQDFVCWLIARNRDIRIMWGTASDDLATTRVREIRLHLQRVEPWEGNPKDIALGRAVKPRYCMTELFGRFRPSAHHGGAWKDDELTVANFGDDKGTGEGPPLTGPTLLALGPKTRQIGARGDFIVWDDLWTRDENDNPVRGAKIKHFFDHTVETRLQPGGTLTLVMQRLGPADLSRYVLDKRVPVLDEETGEETGSEPEYRHIVFPAHHEDLCDGRHPRSRPAWDPDNPVVGNCLTDPKALPPADFVRWRGKGTWLVEYQQGDVDPAGSIFREIWLTGGVDEDRQTYVGCLDRDRALWELPPDVPRSSLASAMAVDVGQEHYWGLVASVHSTDPDSNMEWVLAAERRRMPAGTDKGLIDWDFNRKCFVGVMEDWYQLSKDLGVPFSHVVAETNAAQRHLFRLTNVIDKWQQSRNCRIIAHQTGKNKSDKRLGVEALLGMRFQLGALRLPWHPGPTQHAMRDLYNEVVGYSQGAVTDDVIMTLWMRTLNRQRIERSVAAVDAPGGREERPSWVRAMAR